MSLLSNLQDKLSYALHSMTYDPEAEQYAESKRAAQEAEDAAKKAKEHQSTVTAEEQKALQAEADRKRKEAEDRASRSQFKVGRFLGKVSGTVATIIMVFLSVAGALYGAHLATNLNVYRSWPYRVLYAVYGAIFFPVVIAYVLGYRWFWKGKKPRYYSFLPLIPYFINHPVLARLFSWMSYKPDDVVDAFQEWNPAMVQKGEEAQREAFYEEERLATLEAEQDVTKEEKEKESR